MVYKIIRSAHIQRDLGAILDHLFESYLYFGDDADEAWTRAVSRISAIEDDIERLGIVPYQGTLSTELLPGLRNVTKNQAIFYFDLDNTKRELRLLAVFFGGQDHQRHMLKRLTSTEIKKGDD